MVSFFISLLDKQTTNDDCYYRVGELFTLAQVVMLCIVGPTCRVDKYHYAEDAISELRLF